MLPISDDTLSLVNILLLPVGIYTTIDLTVSFPTDYEICRQRKTKSRILYSVTKQQ